ncbi:sensor histidine kinase [Oceanirhabdus sp. W0125-5]|uniref:sensor histidine kinase n=1 Tax=Oceanirhabdus sp. W0125-5 TaxID=2999116 RepID=UPI0022F2BC4C|nr:HAMP domain-containing sensor histidine kinase [Oceanirhabdus sp. W0125-5]WBW98618.1 HAMP domain-containing sensor histidine kinase [Oceanirhabdus sp. W0125-5]
MKKSKTIYIALITSIVSLIVSFIIVFYFDGKIKTLINNQNSFEMARVFGLFRSVSIVLMIMGIIISVLLFILVIKILSKKSNSNSNNENLLDKECELNNKNLELNNKAKELEEKEKELEYDKLKTEFFANLSHEFKTPLNVLMGSMQLVELYASNGTIIDSQLKLDKYMKTMKKNAFRLLRLINNIIDLTKIDSSYFHLELHNYDIVKIVEGVIESININAKIKSVNITLKKEVEEKIIACDAEKIERILLNILSNALKFTDENGKIEVEIGDKDENVYISVKDDGIGIHEEQLELIFQRFRQVDKSFTRNREGSGIGLSLVKALVEMHNGKIIVDSEYGKGTNFIVQIPVIILEEELPKEMYSNFEDGRLERLRIELSDL